MSSHQVSLSPSSMTKDNGCGIFGKGSLFRLSSFMHSPMRHSSSPICVKPALLDGSAESRSWKLTIVASGFFNALYTAHCLQRILWPTCCTTPNTVAVVVSTSTESTRQSANRPHKPASPTPSRRGTYRVNSIVSTPVAFATAIAVKASKAASKGTECLDAARRKEDNTDFLKPKMCPYPTLVHFHWLPRNEHICGVFCGSEASKASKRRFCKTAKLLERIGAALVESV
mmetsp:Transcript_103449/g.126418  ORF Transcript_103449/g.126418 Transcript_103449/m.126418 type:complete len:229 (-) Transcript_103449:279-965(-)